jgi:N-hydroxyarylamine O-acetyltransferase
MDLQAYLQRIDYPGSLKRGRDLPSIALPSVDRPNIDLLRALHRAHLFTVPFENLDISLGRKIICDEAPILRKIVNEHRGGFCYELNGAFAALLRALRFQVTLLSAQVAREDGSLGPDFDHLTLRVDLEEPWLADVGFGECFLEPLRLDSRLEQPQSGRVYRLTGPSPSEDGLLGLEAMVEGNWRRQYAFTLQPRELSEFAGMCHYHQTSPDSHFTRQRICSLATPEGRLTLSHHKLIEQHAGTRRERLLTGEEEWRATACEQFGVVLPK